MGVKPEGNDTAFWKQLIKVASQNVDYGEPPPELSAGFVSVWANHYAIIASLVSPHQPLLEIGTGFGILAAGLGKLSKQHLFSIEHPSRSYFYQPTYQHFLKQHHTIMLGADLNEGLPFLTDSFQQVYFCDVIEHLPLPVIELTLEEIRRILKPDGLLILSTPNLNRLSNLFRFLSGHSINPPFQVSCHGLTFGHIREFAPKELGHILFRHGFRVTNRKFGCNPYYAAEAFGVEQAFSAKTVAVINRLTSLVTFFLPAMADQLYLTAVRQTHNHLS